MLSVAGSRVGLRVSRAECLCDLDGSEERLGAHVYTKVTFASLMDGWIDGY